MYNLKFRSFQFENTWIYIILKKYLGMGYIALKRNLDVEHNLIKCVVKIKKNN